jgi:hypothetical protein
VSRRPDRENPRATAPFAGARRPPNKTEAGKKPGLASLANPRKVTQRERARPERRALFFPYFEEKNDPLAEGPQWPQSSSALLDALENELGQLARGRVGELRKKEASHLLPCCLGGEGSPPSYPQARMYLRLAWQTPLEEHNFLRSDQSRFDGPACQPMRTIGDEGKAVGVLRITRRLCCDKEPAQAAVKSYPTAPATLQNSPQSSAPHPC